MLAVELFYSYSHRDEGLREQLEKHLSLLRRENVISEWHDRRITAGAEWAKQIDERLKTAGIILLLISADFLASDYCYDIEMSLALERHFKGEAIVIPIVLRPVDWFTAPFAGLQVLPKDAKPLTTWTNRDEGFVDVARGIRAAATRLQTPRTPVAEIASSLDERALDAALPQRVRVGRSTELLAMVRLTESEGLRAFIRTEDEPEFRETDVKSKPFQVEFPRDANGRRRPLRVALQIESPEFEPKKQVKQIWIPPAEDSEVCRFLLTPIIAGRLTVSLEMIVDEVLQTGRVLRTSAEVAGAPAEVPVAMALVSMPVYAWSGPRVRYVEGAPAQPPPKHQSAAAPGGASGTPSFPSSAAPSPPRAPMPPVSNRRRTESLRRTMAGVPPRSTRRWWVAGTLASALLVLAVVPTLLLRRNGSEEAPPLATPPRSGYELTVLDAEGEPLAAVNVAVEGRILATTNESGKAFLDVTRTGGPLRVELTRAGHAAMEATLEPRSPNIIRFER